MNNCIYSSYPEKVHFRCDMAKKAVSPEFGKYGKNVVQACGGGPEKINGIYDAVVETIKFWKEELEKRYENFRGGMDS